MVPNWRGPGTAKMNNDVGKPKHHSPSPRLAPTPERVSQVYRTVQLNCAGVSIGATPTPLLTSS